MFKGKEMKHLLNERPSQTAQEMDGSIFFSIFHIH